MTRGERGIEKECVTRGDKRRENGAVGHVEIDGERNIEWQVDIS